MLFSTPADACPETDMVSIVNELLCLKSEVHEISLVPRSDAPNRYLCATIEGSAKSCRRCQTAIRSRGTTSAACFRIPSVFSRRRIAPCAT